MIALIPLSVLVLIHGRSLSLPCDKGVQLDPENGRAHRTRATVLFALGRLDEARNAVAAASRNGVEAPESFVKLLREESDTLE